MISRSAKQLPGIKLTRLYTVGIRSRTIQGPLLHSQRFAAQQVEDIRGSDGPIDRRICQPLVKPSVLVAFRWSDCTEAWVAEPVCPHSSNRHLRVLPDHKTVKYKILFHHNPVGLVVGLLGGSRSWRVRRQLHARCQADKGDSLPAHSYTSGPASLICSSCETCPKAPKKPQRLTSCLPQKSPPVCEGPPPAMVSVPSHAVIKSLFIGEAGVFAFVS